MPGVANALVPQQGQEGVLRSPRLHSIPSFACCSSSCPEHTGPVNVLVGVVRGWAYIALRIRPNLGEVREEELRVLGFDFALNLIAYSTSQEAQQRS